MKNVHSSESIRDQSDFVKNRLLRLWIDYLVINWRDLIQTESTVLAIVLFGPVANYCFNLSSKIFVEFLWAITRKWFVLNSHSIESNFFKAKHFFWNTIMNPIIFIPKQLLAIIAWELGWLSRFNDIAYTTIWKIYSFLFKTPLPKTALILHLNRGWDIYRFGCNTSNYSPLLKTVWWSESMDRQPACSFYLWCTSPFSSRMMMRPLHSVNKVFSYPVSSF
jgi:hypothetical protein